jgi:hypothetical protein
MTVSFTGDRKKIRAPETRAEMPIRIAVSATARRASRTRGFLLLRRLTGAFPRFGPAAEAAFFVDFFTPRITINVGRFPPGHTGKSAADRV